MRVLLEGVREVGAEGPVQSLVFKELTLGQGRQVVQAKLVRRPEPLEPLALKRVAFHYERKQASKAFFLLCPDLCLADTHRDV